MILDGNTKVNILTMKLNHNYTNLNNIVNTEKNVLSGWIILVQHNIM